jgi:hypothetical protein
MRKPLLLIALVIAAAVPLTHAVAQPYAPPAPTATTGAATNVTATGATLNGTVNPEGTATTYSFQFGTTTSYGFQTVPGNAGSGTSSVSVSTKVAPLSPGTTYHFRVVAVNAGGTTFGADRTFMTPSTGPAVSHMGLFGHTAFVNTRGVAGVFVACIGSTPCIGSMTIKSDGVMIAHRPAFHVGSDNGGFVHLSLNATGLSLIHTHHHLPIQVSISSVANGSSSGSFELVPFT